MFTKSKKYQRFILFGLVFGILALTATVTLTQESWFPSEWVPMIGAVLLTD